MKWQENGGRRKKLEIALQKAAQNNPYLNERAVRQLKEFANEMQKITGIDSDLVLESETKLARLGRSQQQIQQIIQTATNVAATGMMSYDEAIMELNGSLNGVIRTSGRLFPELKSLSQEALAAGEAINIIVGKVNGAAAEAMQTGAGSVTAYQNAIADLKKTLGEDWEKNTGFIREAITQIANEFVRGREEAKKFKEAVNNIKEGTGDVNDELIITEKKLRDLYALFNTEIVMLAINSQQVLENMKNGVDIAIEAHTTAKREFLENLRRQIRQEEALLKTQKERAVILNTINDAIEKINKAQLIVGEDNLIIIEAQRKVLDVQQGIKKFLDMGMTEQAKAYQGMAEQAAIAAANEATRVEKQLEKEEKIRELMNDYLVKLKSQQEWIIKNAELRGEDVNSLSVQNQLLDAQISAYKNLLDTANGLITSELSIEAAIMKTNEKLKERAELERLTEEERKRRLAELAGLHEETKAKIIRIFDDIYKERDRLFDVQAEQDHQAQLEELIKNSLKRSIDFETQYRTEQAKSQQQRILESFDEEYNKKIDQVISMREIEMEQYAEGSASRLAAEIGLLEEIDKLTIEYQNDREAIRLQLEENTAAKIVQIERDASEAVTAAWQTAWNEALSAAQKYLNAASSIASSISAIWHNSIDYETNERLRANDKMVQSDEERAANEKKIMMESAYEKYKADMFVWSANVALATANAAMAVLNALSTQPWYAGLANSIIAGSMGAFQVAAVISAQPKPPRFHTGGIAQGAPGQEVPAILRAGEPVLTQDQFGNVMKAFANVANSRYGGGGTNLTVNVKNNAANMVSTQQSLSPEGLEIVITQIVKKNLGNGGLDDGLALQRSHAGGINITS